MCSYIILSDKKTSISDILVHTAYLSNTRAEHGDYINGATMVVWRLWMVQCPW